MVVRVKGYYLPNALCKLCPYVLCHHLLGSYYAEVFSNFKSWNRLVIGGKTFGEAKIQRHRKTKTKESYTKQAIVLKRVKLNSFIGGEDIGNCNKVINTMISSYASV